MVALRSSVHTARHGGEATEVVFAALPGAGQGRGTGGLPALWFGAARWRGHRYALVCLVRLRLREVGRSTPPLRQRRLPEAHLGALGPAQARGPVCGVRGPAVSRERRPTVVRGPEPRRRGAAWKVTVSVAEDETALDLDGWLYRYVRLVIEQAQPKTPTTAASA